MAVVGEDVLDQRPQGDDVRLREIVSNELEPDIIRKPSGLDRTARLSLPLDATRLGVGPVDERSSEPDPVRVVAQL